MNHAGFSSLALALLVIGTAFASASDDTPPEPAAAPATGPAVEDAQSKLLAIPGDGCEEADCVPGIEKPTTRTGKGKTAPLAAAPRVHRRPGATGRHRIARTRRKPHCRAGPQQRGARDSPVRRLGAPRSDVGIGPIGLSYPDAAPGEKRTWQ
jgi:hypothetical protein